MGNVYGLPERRTAVRPSPVFLGIVAVFVATGAVIWRAGQDISQSTRLAVFGFVLAGWVVSLCLHEFGHAFFAWRSGDHGIATRGYLTLNPLKYVNVGLSILLPLVFVLAGGIGMPGGAVYVDRGAINGRLKNSLISAAGPLANVIFAIGLALLISGAAGSTHAVFWVAMSYLAFLQVTAAILNLLPVPGLDGFGIWEPFLPRDWVAKAAQVGGYGFMALFLLLWIPSVNREFFDGIFYITSALGLHDGDIYNGQSLFQFWHPY
jgi:Zn-dependent protease